MTFASRLKKRLYFTVAAYFRFFANFSLRRWQPRIIVITGSVGKTTMLHLLEQELGKKAHYSHNANSAYGISFDILGLQGITGSKLRWFYLFLAAPVRAFYYQHSEKFYIAEIDGERPFEAEFLARWLKPEVTFWLSLGRSHAIQFQQQVKDGIFDSVDQAIAHEFAMLPQYTSHRIYIDNDVPLISETIDKIQQNHNISAQIIGCSKADLKDYSVFPDHTSIKINQTEFIFSEPIPRDITIQLVMLIDFCKYLNISLKTDLSHLTMPPGRNSFFQGKNGLKIIDSSYNAHLISVKSILEMTQALKVKHKWLVIGDMVEQGDIEGEEHRKLAEVIAEVKPEQVILIGRRTKKYTAPVLKKLGFTAFTTNDPHQALKFIQTHATGKETIVFKGSQYLEWIIEKLLKNPSDSSRLPRREKAAVKRRLKKGLDS